MAKKSGFFKKLLSFIGWLAFYSLIFVASLFLTMYILIRGETVKVPDLIGTDIKTAFSILSKRGINLKIRDQRYAMNFDKGKIIEQLPQPGEKIKKGHTVYVVVSKGKDSVVVPDFVGKDFKMIDVELLQYHLVLGRKSAIHSPQPENTIIAQFPEAGQEVPAETQISFLVSLGPQKKAYIMPDLIGKNINDVFKKIESAGLQLGPVHYVSYYGFPSGTIIRQFPNPGYKITEGNIITLEVTR